MSVAYDILYADTDARFALLLAALRRAQDRGEPVGFDTEFYNVRLGQESTVARAKGHLASFAWARGAEIHPRGFPVPMAAVVPWSVLLREEMREWLAGPGIKVVHNMPVDAHTCHNAGVKINGGVNSLTLARWTWPHRARTYGPGGGFTLDALGSEILGIGKTEEFRQLFSEEVTEYRVRTRTVKGCECGCSPCRRRSTTPGHSRFSRVEEIQTPFHVVRPVPLESVGPGHALWQRALRYSAQDSVIGFGLYHVMLREMKRTERIVPWR